VRFSRTQLRFQVWMPRPPHAKPRRCRHPHLLYRSCAGAPIVRVCHGRARTRFRVHDVTPRRAFWRSAAPGRRNSTSRMTTRIRTGRRANIHDRGAASMEASTNVVMAGHHDVSPPHHVVLLHKYSRRRRNTSWSARTIRAGAQLSTAEARPSIVDTRHVRAPRRYLQPRSVRASGREIIHSGARSRTVAAETFAIARRRK